MTDVMSVEHLCCVSSGH